MGVTYRRYLDMYYLGWLAAAVPFKCSDSLHDAPLFSLVGGTLYNVWMVFPTILVVFNLLFPLYWVLFGHCFAAMLYGLIRQQQTVCFDLSYAQIFLRTVCLTVTILAAIFIPLIFTGDAGSGASDLIAFGVKETYQLLWAGRRFSPAIVYLLLVSAVFLVLTHSYTRY